MVRSPVGCLVSRLFSRLASDDISYVVLRNYEGLPNSVGHDLDLLLDEGDLARYRSLLRMTAEDCGWKIVRVESRYGYWKCYLYRPDSTERSFLQIDAFYPQHYRGMPWFSSVEVLADRVAYGEFYIPAPGHEAADLLLKELLGSGRMKDLIERLKGEADIVLFDSPPTLVASDAAVLATQLDGVLMVIDVGETRREVAARAVDSLRQVGVRVYGAVLNQVSRRQGGYYYYYYHHYYSDDGEGEKKRTRRRRGQRHRFLDRAVRRLRAGTTRLTGRS